MKTFDEACSSAQSIAQRYSCTQHVNATVRVDPKTNTPVIVSYVPSDWFSTEATLRTYAPDGSYADQ